MTKPYEEIDLDTGERYLLRNGLTGTCLRTDMGGTFSCSVYVDDPPSGWAYAYKPNGQFRPSGEHPFDIVSILKGEDHGQN